jgi:tRNA-2-methylthio-N6-dimethylallyladenosine synthase
VADLVKLDRLNRLNRLVNEVAEERAQRFLGRPLEARASLPDQGCN